VNCCWRIWLGLSLPNKKGQLEACRFLCPLACEISPEACSIGVPYGTLQRFLRRGLLCLRVSDYPCPFGAPLCGVSPASAVIISLQQRIVNAQKIIHQNQRRSLLSRSRVLPSVKPRGKRAPMVKIRKLSSRKKRSSHHYHEPGRRNRSGVAARMEINRLTTGPPMARRRCVDFGRGGSLSG